uniref:MADS-box domain-containing protein n=1 Tax=Solanum lycopersicum TaxID=4081 RepID=A0A3Q7H689_SOLLC
MGGDRGSYLQVLKNLHYGLISGMKFSTKICIGRNSIVIARIQNLKNGQVTFSKRLIGLFKKASELCTLCGAYVDVVLFSSSNKVYSCGHPSAELIVDKSLGENLQPGFDSPIPTVLAHQNVNVDEINKKTKHVGEFTRITEKTWKCSPRIKERTSI